MAVDREKRLPLQIRSALRYVFTQDGSQAADILKGAADDVGFPVEPAFDWVELWEDLHKCFEGRVETFVPTIEALVAAAVQVVHAICSEDDAYADKLIESIKELSAGVGQRYMKRALYLFVDIDASLSEWAPQVRWVQSPSRRGLVLALSPKSSLSVNSVSPETLRETAQHMFEPPKDQPPPVRANVPIAPAMTSPQVISSAPVPSIPTMMPTVGQLPSPGGILASTPPYIARIYGGHSSVTIECSHQATLTMISQYLEKWTRRNPHQSNTPFVRVELIESLFGTGGTYEALIIKPWLENSAYQAPICQMLPLALLQGPLGYRILSTDGLTIVLKRDLPFS